MRNCSKLAARAPCDLISDCVTITVAAMTPSVYAIHPRRWRIIAIASASERGNSGRECSFIVTATCTKGGEGWRAAERTKEEEK